MLKLGAAYYHVTRRGEIDQPHTIGDSVRMKAELFASGAKDIFLPNLRIKTLEHDFLVMGRALIICVLELSVEGFLNPIVLFFRQCVSTN